MLALLACLVVLSSAASGCGTQPVASASSGTPQRGGTFTITNGEPSTLDPAIDWEQSGWAVLHTLYQTLYDYAPAPGAAGQKLEPVLAAAMPTVSSDGLTYTIPLRKGVRFAPPVGRELTANDVRFSFERMLRTPQAPGTSFYENIVGVPDFIAGKGTHVSGFRVIDPSTIEIRLRQPDPTLLHTLAMEFCDVMPPEWVKKWGDKIGRHPLGSGPFMFDYWTAGSAIVVKRNPDYRDADHVWLDTIKFEAAYGSERDLMRVQRDELDCTYLTHATWLQVKDNPQLKKGLQMEVWPAMDYLVLNTQMKPFDDMRVRQAMSWAINRDKIARFAGGSPLFQIYPPGVPGNDPAARFYGYDPARARALLVEAGYPNGFATTIHYAADPDDYMAKIAQVVQNDLKGIGVRANLEQHAMQIFYSQASKPGTYAASLNGWIVDFPDPYSWVKALFTRGTAVAGSSNWSFWWDPKLETMIAAAQRTSDPADRLAKFAEMQTLISDQAPVVPIDSWYWATLNGPHVGGYYLHPVYICDAAHYWHQ